MATETETTQYDIVIKAQEAVRTLAELSRHADTFDQRIIKVAQTIDIFAKKNKMAWRDVLADFQLLDQRLKDMGKKSIFGRQGTQGWDLTQQFLASAEAGNRLTSVTNKIPSSVDNAGKSMKKGAESANEFAHGLKGIANIARGTLVAIALFRLLTFIEDSLRKATEEAKKFERALFNLRVAEQALSEAGVDVTLKDFQELGKEIRELFPYISKIDITKMISSLAVLTKDLGLTNEQFAEMAKTIPILAAQSGDTIESVTEQVVNGLANSGRGWKDLGIVVDANIIKQKAIEIGLVASADAYNKLTAEQKQHIEVLALISILGDSAAIAQEKQGEFLESNLGKVQASSAAWEDFLVILGQFTLGGKALLGGFLIPILEVLGSGIQMFKAFLIVVEAAQQAFFTFATNIQEFLRNPLDFQGFNEGVADAFNVALEEGFNRFFSGQIPDDAPQWFQNLFGRMADQVDTPTNLEALQQGLDNVDTSKAQEEIQALLEDLAELDRREADLREEFAIRSEREAQDFYTEQARREQDFQIDRRRAIIDANREIAEKNRKYREKELNDEAKFQEQLRQLREKFLFDLEDALRDRDARQVLRLQAKYRMDKEALINEHLLRQRQDAQDHANDVAQARSDLAEKLRRMDEDHALEQARREQDFQEEQQRRLEDFQRQLAEIQEQRQIKMEQTAQAIGEEYGLKEEGVKAIYNLLNQYYGPGGIFDGLYNYANASMLSSAQSMLSQLSSIIGGFSAIPMMGMAGTLPPGAAAGAYGIGPRGSSRPSTTTQPAHRPSVRNIGAQATGGSYLATGPTRALFGEQGPEVATFVPLGRSGASVGAAGVSGEGSVNGRLSIELLLSPDLEARIMENTLNKTADIVTRVVRSK